LDQLVIAIVHADETARVKAQQEVLGEKGLEEKAEKLEVAITKDNKSFPEEIMSSLKVPGMESIHFFEIKTARSGLGKKLGEMSATR
jgi:hypothetical protein